MSFENLDSATESEIATLLGVSQRMVRKYMMRRGLPCMGAGSTRRFSWPEVLEWYLLYRVEIFSKGGQQRTTLGLRLREMLEKAISAAEADCAARFERREQRKALQHESQIEKLKAAALQRAPYRRLRIRRR